MVIRRTRNAEMRVQFLLGAFVKNILQVVNIYGSVVFLMILPAFDPTVWYCTVVGMCLLFLLVHFEVQKKREKRRQAQEEHQRLVAYIARKYAEEGPEQPIPPEWYEEAKKTNVRFNSQGEFFN